MTEVTRILEQIETGNPKSTDQLLAIVYDELRCLAMQKMANERPGQTLQATALVHEAYMRLVGADRPSELRFSDRQHFFRAAAEVMRRILVDQARQKRRVRHGGGRLRMSLSQIEPAADVTPNELIALNDALDEFCVKDPVKGDLIKLRYFGGFSEAEAAEMLGISRATASRYWNYARAWLINAIDKNSAKSTES